MVLVEQVLCGNFEIIFAAFGGKSKLNVRKKVVGILKAVLFCSEGEEGVSGTKPA